MKFFFCFFALLALTYAIKSQVIYKKVKVTDNIFSFIYPNSANDWIDGNCTVIFGKDQVFVVDATLTPKTAETVVEFIKSQTTNPVKFLLVTHWHYDHSLGAESFKKAYPQMEIVSGKMTDTLMKSNYKEYRESIGGFQVYVDTFKAEIERGSLADGTLLSEYEIGRRKLAVTYADFYMPQLENAVQLWPTVTFEDSLNFDIGSNDVKVLGYGCGHTENDAYVFIPGEKVLIAGDLVVHPVPMAFSVFPSKWINTLKQISALDFDIIIPGHGAVIYGKDYLLTLIKLLEFVYTDVSRLNSEGKTIKEIFKLADKEKTKEIIGIDSDDKKWAFDNHFYAGLIYSIYNELNPKK